MRRVGIGPCVRVAWLLAAIAGGDVAHAGNAAPSAKHGLYVPGSQVVSGGFAGRPLARNLRVETGERYHPEVCNGDVYAVTRAGTTGAETPREIPRLRYAATAYRAGDVVYPGFAGGGWRGHWFRVVADCTTSRAPAVPWCTTEGCRYADGTCALREEPSHDVRFADGTAALVRIASAGDAYCGIEDAYLGQTAPVAPDLAVYGGDNQGALIHGGARNVTGAPYSTSRANVGQFYFYFGGGDARSNTPDNALATVAGEPVLRVQSSVRLPQPYLAPTVRLLDGGELHVGQRYCYAVEWGDKVTGAATSVGPSACAVPTATARTVEVTMPEGDGFEWPAPGGGRSRSQVRAWVFAGDRAQWCTFVDTLEDPGDAVVLTADADVQENATCAMRNLTGVPVLEVGSGAGPSPWTAHEPVLTSRTTVVPTVRDGFAYMAVRVNCRDRVRCRDCERGAASRGVTGASEPAWNPAGELTCDDGVAWMRMGFDGTNLVIGARPDGPQLLFLGARDAQERLPIVAGVNDGALELYDPAAPNPLTAPRARLSRDGLLLAPQPPTNTCDAPTRGTFRIITQPDGHDEPEACLRHADGTYAWTTLAR